MDVTTWLPIIFGAIQTVYTVLLYQRDMPASRKPGKPSTASISRWTYRVLVSLTVLTWLAIAYNYYSLYETQILTWLDGNQLEIVADKTIANRTVLLDGHSYRNIDFDNVTFEYNGGKFELVNNRVINASFQSRNPDIDHAIEVFGKLGLLRAPTWDSNGQRVPPGAHWSGQ
jgi:hypothetical protein